MVIVWEPAFDETNILISVVTRQLSMLIVVGEQLLRQVFLSPLQLQIGLMAILLGRYASTFVLPTVW